MKKNLTLTLMGCASLLAASASANIFTFQTASGAMAGGENVDAKVVFTTTGTTLDIKLTDLFANPTDVGQLLSDLSFHVTIGTTTSATITSDGPATTVTVGSGGTETAGTVTHAGWVLDSEPAGTIHLDDLGSHASGPANLIIGPDNGSGKYSNANGSIANNGPHNPFLTGTVDFKLTIPGMTADTVINDVLFSFGTTSGVTSPGGPPTVPDGGTTVLLLGAALSGLGLIRRKLC